MATLRVRLAAVLEAAAAIRPAPTLLRGTGPRAAREVRDNSVRRTGCPSAGGPPLFVSEVRAVNRRSARGSFLCGRKDTPGQNYRAGGIQPLFRLPHPIR